MKIVPSNNENTFTLVTILVVAALFGSEAFSDEFSGIVGGQDILPFIVLSALLPPLSELFQVGGEEPNGENDEQRRGDRDEAEEPKNDSALR